MNSDTRLPMLDDDPAQWRRMFDDLREPDPRRYVVDTAAPAVIGWAAFGVALLPLALPWRMLALVVAGLLLYRALAFIHELIHQPALRRYRWFWHAVAGVPLLLPLLLYLPIHQAHHNAATYGTLQDGEYDQFRGRPRRMAAKLLLMNLAIPLALLVRFAVLAPLSGVLPVVREKVIPGFVHLAVRLPFTAPPVPARYRVESGYVEAACAAVAWVLIGTALMGHSTLIATWAALVIVIAMLNTLRALGATHLYIEQPAGRDTLGQLGDSINLDGNAGLLSRLLCPVGLDLHGLHHVAPQIPYHHLRSAHERLMAALPADSAYRASVVTSVLEGWRRLLRAADRVPASPAGDR